MKKYLAIFMTVIMVMAIVAGCVRSNDSDTEETSVFADDIPIEMSDDIVSFNGVETDEDGDEVVIATDEDGNTVEFKKNDDGTITKTIIDKNSGEKTEQSAVVANANPTKKTTTTTKKTVTTTKKVVTTTKKQTTTTTKKAVTTTKKPVTTTKKSVTTTKPTTTKKPVTTTKKTVTTTKSTTTVHTHNYTAVYKTQRVKVKDAYDEPVYKEVQAFYCSGCGIECRTEAKKYGVTYSAFHLEHSMPKQNNGIIPLCPKASNTNTPTMRAGSYFGKPNTVKIQTGTVHHDAVYEDRKVVDYYKCSCGATKK